MFLSEKPTDRTQTSLYAVDRTRAYDSGDASQGIIARMGVVVDSAVPEKGIKRAALVPVI